MDIAFFGSSLVSAYWNGAATYYRGILRALAERGHRIRFFEPDAYDRRRHRDIDDPPWADVHVYPADENGALRALERARGADLVVKASRVGVHDALLDEGVLELGGPATLVAYWDVDAPATLDAACLPEAARFCNLVPRFDVVFTYGGGIPVVRAYQSLGARACVPIYNAVDPHTHHPVPPQGRFAADLSFLGNRLPDREQRVEDFFFEAARRLPTSRFLLGGSGWSDKPMPKNVRYIGHVYTSDHNALNVSARAVLDISRESMARYGYSPATRVFEAAGAAACLISDRWEGLELFLEPGAEILLASSGEEVAERVWSLDGSAARRIGERARRRVLQQHTYAHRALDVERALDAQKSPPAHAVSGMDGVEAGDEPRLDIVVAGLSITSSWGNGHATTYRALVRELSRRGHRVTFLERNTPWYAANRDDSGPTAGSILLYDSLEELQGRFGSIVADADCVIVGSYVPDGAAVCQWALDTAGGVKVFYDIDTPVTLAALASGQAQYLDPAQVPRFDLYLSFAGGPILRHIERRHGARQARALYCSVDPEVYYPEACTPRWTLGYMGTYSEDRQPTLEQLLVEPARHLPTSRFVVAGPQYPASVQWPANVSRIEHLAPPDHRSFYNRQMVTLNLTRRDMIASGYAPSVRLFEAAACAVPIVSDRWEGIDSFLEIGSEILVADTSEDILAILRGKSRRELAEIASSARRRVLGEHTAAHRAATLEGYLREVIPRRSATRTVRSL